MKISDIKVKDKYIHRDISWLTFNQRVLSESQRKDNPLLERLRFIAISSGNLDEFLMVRLAALKRLVDSGYTGFDDFGWYAYDLMLELDGKVKNFVDEMYAIYEKLLNRDLAKEKIGLKKFEDLTKDEKKFVNMHFENLLFPSITPIAIDQGRPFPALPSKTKAFAVILERFGTVNLAIVPIPSNIPRILRLPSHEKEFKFITVEEIVRNNFDKFFKGYNLKSSTIFRIMRDSELSVEEEFTPDLLRSIENEIKKRPKAKVVWAEVEFGCEEQILNLLCEALDFPVSDVVRVKSEIDLTYLFEMISNINRPDLLYKSFVPGDTDYPDIFAQMQEAAFILHVPFQDFKPTIDLLKTASVDENVLAIKITLYRTNEDSAVIESLVRAAKNGKQVTVLVEIKARFDEQRNIVWVSKLEDAGCHVMYGIAGIKVHSKLALVVRREEDRIRRYVHLSTGNYNEKTARVYTDIGYFTDNDDFARDVSDVFNVITGYSVPSRWKRIMSSPYDLRNYFFELIDNEINFQKENGNGLIIAKMNSLEDTQLIDKLYEASGAGVKIRLIVRGICCLTPGVPKLSENIEIRSVVGRFLEHSRIYFFNNNSNYRLFLASADWMRRNMDRRIELLFEIYRQDIKDELKTILEIYLKDNVDAWSMGGRGYTKIKKKGAAFSSQNYFLEKHCLNS